MWVYLSKMQNVANSQLEFEVFKYINIFKGKILIKNTLLRDELYFYVQLHHIIVLV